MQAHKICVVGGGYWGKNHIRTLNQMGVLVAIVEKDSGILEKYFDIYPNVDCYNTLKEAFNDDQINGYIVATPAETHFSIAKRIISKCKHVLVEKPFTLDIHHAEKLVKLSKANKVNLMVGHVLLFHPAIKKIKNYITKGKIGKLQYIYSNRLNLGKVRTEENVFWSLAPHDIALMQYFTNSFPEKISTNGSIFLQQGVHDSTITQLKYPNGVEGHIFVSWLHPFKEHRLVVIGSEAMVTFEDSLEGKPLKFYSKKYDMKNGFPEKNDGPIETINYEMKMPLEEELKYFCSHLENKPPQISNGEHALEVTRILVNASLQLNKENK